MKRKILIASLALGLLSVEGFAKTLVVSETINGNEKIIAQKEIAVGETGTLQYNLCANVEGISADDYQRCESRVQYMNTQYGEKVTTAIEFHHYEFVEFKQFPDRKIAILSHEQIGGAFLTDKADQIVSQTPEKKIRVFIKETLK